MTLTDDGHLLVTLGRANAVAVYHYAKPLEPVSYVGLLPTDYFPAEITTVGDDVVVSNTRGIDALRNTSRHGTHDTTSSLHGSNCRATSHQGLHGAGLRAERLDPNSVQYAKGKGKRSRCRCRRSSATPRRSSTSSCSSRRTGPTTRSSATSPKATATRR